MENYMENVKKLYGLLDIERKMVGVKLAHSKEEYDSYEAKNLLKPLSYCVTVKSASMGNRLKFVKETSGCGGSTRALGLEKPQDDFLDGTSPLTLGLFKDLDVSKKAALVTCNILFNVYGVLVQPIEYYEEYLPDVVIIIGKPRELMRVVQGYSFHKGISREFSMSGNQGICVEATAYPLVYNTINFSLLCSGTRFLAKWRDDEGALGIPINLLGDIVDGLYQTVNAVEMGKRKKEIKQAFLEQDIECMEFDYEKTYYTEYEREKREKREADKKK